MTASILVVDFGRHETSAALVTGDQTRQVACPQLNPHQLSTIVGAMPVQIDRVVLTVETMAARSANERATLTALAAHAGFPDAELLGCPSAAALDPRVRPDLPDDGLVLVCDLGVVWSVALIGLRAEQATQLAEDAAAEGLTRAGTDTALRWLAASCRAVVARAGYSLGEVAGVILIGAGARAASAEQVMGSELGRPVWQPTEPEFAVLRGAAHWAARREIKASAPTWRFEPLCWEIGEPARLVRWTVAEGQTYVPGTVLAQVRTLDDRVFDLQAACDGIMIEHRLTPGAFAGSGEVLAICRSSRLISGDRPVKRLELRVSGDWLLTPDNRHVVECSDSGAHVRMRAIDSGAIVHEIRPDAAQFGRIFVHPAGRMALVAWDDEGQFGVWDVPTGRLVNRFRAAARPLTVQVHEGQWRLASEVDRQVSVGRYRRDVATMWDLDTGEVVEQLVGDDLRRHFGGYVDRTSRHGFSAEVRSPDGRLRAGSTQMDGHAAVWLHREDTDEEVFRAQLSTARPVGSAFSADGHYLMSNWRTDDASCLDVWKI